MTSPTAEPYDLVTARHDYPAWDGTPQRTILLCTHPRSGSTLLGEALYFAGGLGCPLEYFHVGFRPALAARWGAEAIGAYTRAVHAHRTDPGGVLAVKLFWHDVLELAHELDPHRFPDANCPPPEDIPPHIYRSLAQLLAPLFPAPSFVHLQRRDRIRQAVSGAVATDTGRFRAIPALGEKAPKAEPGFDFDRIERLIGHADACHGHWRNFFAALGEVPHSLSYEDLVSDYRQSVRGVLDHLGSRAEPPAPRMRRQADARNESFVLRYLRERAARGQAG